jgi:hypothetical protein
MSNNFEQAGAIDDTAGEAGAGCDRIDEDYMWSEFDDDCAAAEEREQHRQGQGDSENCRRKRARRRALRVGGELSLAIMAKEYIWLWDVRHGVSTNEIAMRERVTTRRIQQGLARAKAQERSSPSDSTVHPPRLIPLFPIGSYTPQSTCAHQGPIERGSLLCCMICHCSGVDDHPGLMRSPLTDPEPEPKPAPAPACTEKQAKRETRKERRQRLFGTQVLATSA